MPLGESLRPIANGEDLPDGSAWKSNVDRECLRPCVGGAKVRLTVRGGTRRGGCPMQGRWDASWSGLGWAMRLMVLEGSFDEWREGERRVGAVETL